MGTTQARILIAEDSRVNQMILMRMLEQFGFQVDVVSSGSEAVSAVENSTYDIVFMDVMMPGLDGIEATKKIINYHSFGDRPKIVALTADTMAGEKEKCMEAGMDGYLPKPVRLEEVITTLRRWIQFQTRPVSESNRKTEQFGLGKTPLFSYQKAV